MRGCYSSNKDWPSLVLISELIGLLIFIISFTTLVFTCNPSILTELSGTPKPPTMEILALSVSGLNVSYTNKNVSAKWGVELVVQNPNLFSTLYLDHMVGMVLYKEEVIGVSSLEKKLIALGPMEHKFVSFKVWKKDWDIDDEDQPKVKEWVVENIMMDKHKEKINFSVQMGVWGKIKSSWWSSKSVIMNPRCMDLTINFVPMRGFGMLLDEEPIRCYVPMLDN
ncbi:hypothetical protein S83_053767 [Arachis hypogaea]|uniref:Late embryogenesis abundant protein LEA-2 subgroup domain-containing protein n=2 Tax=Arachis TaxID=3817 RepID=A0A444YHP0_ARAHY|nr:hypothetical protein Ahy_B06g080328 [Arachis hypogaea]